MKCSKKTYAIIMVLILWAYGLWSLFPQDYSALEMRKGAERPSLTKENLFDGSFGEAYETYLTDHAPLKPLFYELHSRSRYALGVREIKEVYLTKDRLYQKPLENPALEKLLAEKKDKMDVILLPYKLYYEKNFPLALRPLHLETYQEEYAAKKRWADHDLSEILTLDDYYKGDHHLQNQGIKKVLQALRLGDYEEGMAYSFTGGLSRKTGLPIKDTFLPLHPPATNPLFTYGETEAHQGEEYVLRRDLLEEVVDKYLYYVGGNYGKLTIQGEGKGHLLLIKDSFANPFLAFYAKQYEKITVLDLRFLRENPRPYLEQADHIIVFCAL